MTFVQMREFVLIGEDEETKTKVLIYDDSDLSIGMINRYFIPVLVV